MGREQHKCADCGGIYTGFNLRRVYYDDYVPVWVCISCLVKRARFCWQHHKELRQRD